MLVLGDFKGGTFGTAANENLTVGSGEGVIFNGLKDHWSRPFSGGDRISLVFFAHTTAHLLKKSDLDELSKLGFGHDNQLAQRPPRVDPVSVTPKKQICGDGGLGYRNFVHARCEKGIAYGKTYS